MEIKEHRLREEWVNIQVHLKGPAGSVPNDHHKASIAIKPIAIFMLVEGLAFLL